RQAPGALEVHGDHEVEVLLGHPGDHPVADDARVVDDGVEVAVGVDGAGDEPPDAVEVVHRGGVGAGPPTHLLDLGDDLVGRRFTDRLAVQPGAKVVHDHRRTVAGELEAVLAAETPATACHDHHPVVEHPHGAAPRIV